MRSTRLRRRACAALGGLLAVATLPLAFASPASAEGPITLTMPEGGGELRTRGSTEPTLLGSPTTVTGTQAADGTISGVTVATPMISTMRQITSPLTADVYVDISFSMASPGFGGVDPEGNVVITAPMKVDVHIDVMRPPLISGDCVASPVNLELRSTAPYDPATKHVELEAANFSIPAMPTTASCSALIVGSVNEELAGSGHSMKIKLDGDLALGTVPAQPSVTTVTATPSEVKVNEPVTLAATVAPAVPGGPMPTGGVTFRDGSTVLGSALLDETGVATTTVTNIPIGTRTVTADYGGESLYDPSSGTTTVRVASAPTLNAEIPSTVTVGEAPKEFDITVDNSTLGTEVGNLRVDAYATSTLVPRIKFEIQQADESWLEVVPGTSTTNAAPLGDPAGFVLAAGEQKVIKARVSGRDTPVVGNFNLRLVQFDPATPATLTQVQLMTGAMSVGAATRAPSTITGGTVTNPLVTPIVITNGTLEVYSMRAAPATGPVVPLSNAMFQMEIDGTPVPIRAANAPVSAATTAPTVLGTYTVVTLPTGLAPGQHTLTAYFLGSQNLQPVAKDFPFTVVSRAGALYDCSFGGGSTLQNQWTGRARINALAGLPTYAVAGRPVTLDNLAVSIETERSVTGVTKWNVIPNNATTPLPSTTNLRLNSVAFDFGPAGTGAATSVTRAGGTVVVDPADPVQTQTIGFGGATASLNFDGAPGSTVPLALEKVNFTINSAGGPVAGECAPVGEPTSLGSVQMTGTTLALEAPTPAYAGDTAKLTASVVPDTLAGRIVFRDGPNDVGVVPVTAGTASLEITGLTAGEHSFTARFEPTAGGVPSTTSAPAKLTVQVRPACSTMIESGNGAYVRHLYVTVLGRCPDAGGYAMWKSKLDAGMSPASVAQIIGASPEAVQNLVKHGYQTMLGRAADPGGLTQWTNTLKTTKNYTSFISLIGSSPEAYSKAGGTNTGYVNYVFQQLLGRAPTASELSTWVGRLDAKSVLRSTFVKTIFTDTESLTNLVNGWYDDMLGRVPTATELSGAISRLRSTGNLQAETITIARMSEFYQYAQTLPS